MYFTPSGISIDSKPEDAKASELKPVTLEGISMAFKEEQDRNALRPMLRKPSGSDTFARFTQLAKA